MASRRDQLHGYRFLSRRNASALLHSDTDTAEGPLRRLSGSTAASVAVGVIAVVLVLLVGLLRPGGGTWQDGKSLIVASDSGSRYVYLGGVLHPVLNYASALLILRNGAVAPVTVSAGALDRVRRGAPVGIPDAPDEVPATGSLLKGPWVACSAPGTDAAEAPRPLVTVSVGQAAQGTALTSASAVLVTAPNGFEYLIWNGTRLLLRSYALTALGYSSASPIPVGAGFVNALPQGPDLAAPEPPAASIGRQGPAVGGTRTLIGEVYQAGGAYYAVYPDGLAPVTTLQEGLMLADPAIARIYPGSQARALPLSLSAAQQATPSARHPARDTGLPAAPVALSGGQGGATQLCATVNSAAADAVTVTEQPASPQGASAAEPADQLGHPLADAVHIPSGRGAVIQAVSGPGATAGPTYLVTDTGQKFGLAPSGSVLSDLGLSGAHPVPVPQNVVDLLRTGPTLDESAAAQLATTVP
jgi:type VII secretion protein EccB